MKHEFRSCARGFVALLSLGLLLGGCMPETETFRYRLTAEVDTPTGLKSGSSVIEVELSENDSQLLPIEARGVRATLRGEAVAVDLPDGQVLFTLLRSEISSDAAKWFAHETIDTPEVDGHIWGVARARWMKDNKASGEMQRGDYFPMLVAFGDPNDPASIQRVDPDDLAASFGEGVTLSRITVQLTDDPLTIGIEDRLGWLVDPAVMENPGWQSLPLDARRLLLGLRAGKVGSEK